ncbi:cytochrome c biogenesis CcdA family protein [Chloroflexota bacterium]
MVGHISVPVAFGAGLLSFLSPCVLPLVPVYLGILGGAQIYQNKAAGMRLPLFLHSFSFVLGFSVVFTALGVLAGLSDLDVDAIFLNRIAGSLLICFGLFILVAQKVRWLNYEKRLTPSLGTTTGYFRSFIVGAAFSLSWTACVGPILGSILVLAAVQATVWQGAYLLAVYSLGLGLPFLIIGAAFGSILPLLRRINQYSHIIHVVSSLLLIIIGILILMDKLGLISSLGA